MAYNKEQQERWIFATFLALCILSVLYFVFLFPREATTVMMQSLTNLIASLIVMLSFGMLVLLFQKEKNKQQEYKLRQNERQKKDLKIIEQLIWRNRYVLQSIKEKLKEEDSPDNNEKWKEEKEKFARKYVLPQFSEENVPMDIVTGLLDKALRGGIVGGIKPPTYKE